MRLSSGAISRILKAITTINSSADFIGCGPFLLDDIILEELSR
jgi:hypothetical protein